MAYPIEFNFRDYSLFEKSDEEVLSIALVRVYYLIRGRNAWHSTWVTTYNKNSFHSNFNSAKDNAEKLRERGSKFSINQIPGILIKTESWDALVMQINTLVPFGNYSHKRLCSCFENTTRKRIFLRRGMRLSSVLNTFDPNSEHWTKTQKMKNNIIVELGKNSSFEWNTDYKNEWKRWESYSRGGEYILGWQEYVSNLDIDSIKKLIVKAKRTPPDKSKVTNLLK